MQQLHLSFWDDAGDESFTAEGDGSTAEGGD